MSALALAVALIALWLATERQRLRLLLRLRGGHRLDPFPDWAHEQAFDRFEAAMSGRGERGTDAAPGSGPSPTPPGSAR